MTRPIYRKKMLTSSWKKRKLSSGLFLGTLKRIEKLGSQVLKIVLFTIVNRDVSLAELDGVTVVLRLTGRFWHKKSDVLARVSLYLQNRIPEVCDVVIEDESQLDDADEKVEKLRL
ncbi:hypothetical protein NDN08_001026 [Rhodosorus marinus]|uniref:Uncharacterized protein n=1 Tax=Rhodosorus marinus TaxID=101924 RepID=A0AAV8UTW1_9RHOD|nr:hypothetical protein NDN08_001026 [Rhodosorus marinus]